ncbi:MAG: cupin domain-containing protein [Pseudomonadota bacterium]|nr:cupin domain-containing protein [Pseudomonadota bacterium]
MSAIPPLFQPPVSFADPRVAPMEWRPPAERIVSGDPLQRAWNLYDSADGHFSAGIWECQPGKWRVVFTESEFCHLLEGRIEVTGDDGSVRVFSAGEAFVSPAGFTGYWEVLEPARKYYAIHE